MSTPIPQPPGIPLLGNVFDVDPASTWNSLKKLTDQYGSIVKIKVLGHQIVFIGDAALLEEICDETRFRKCVTGPIVEIREAVHDSLFTAYHHEETSWGIAHRILAPFVTQSAAQAIFSRMSESASDLVEKWTKSPEGKKVDVTNDLQRLDVQTVRYGLFSQRHHYLEGKEPAMIPAMASSTMEAVKRPTRPKFLNWLFHQRGFNRDIRTIRDYGTEIVNERKSAEGDGEEYDMLNAMLHGKDSQTGKSLTDSQVLDEIINMFIGSATSPCLVSAAIYYILKSKDSSEIISKARQEIDSLVGSTSQIPGDTDLTKFSYCEAILREAFRLSAPAPGFNIEPIPSNSNDPITLAGGKYQVPANQPMIAVLAAVNRDPAVFSDPETFRPERMQGENYDNLPSGVKHGFGNGKRECFGKKYAWQWGLLTLIVILRSVDMEMADKGYELRQNGAFCVQPLEFFAIVKPRAAQK